MALGGPAEPDGLERIARTCAIAADPERDLVDDALADEVATRILREVARARPHGRPVPRAGVEQARSELRQRSSFPTRSALRARRSRRV